MVVYIVLFSFGRYERKTLINYQLSFNTAEQAELRFSQCQQLENISGVNVERSVRVTEIQTYNGSIVTKRSASTFTSVLSPVNNEPFQKHPRENESQHHVCVWSTGCEVWISPVSNTQPQVDGVKLCFSA